MAAKKKRKIAGPGRLGSIKAAKKTLARKGGDGRIRTIPAENDITVRFLTEPEEFHGFYEHWSQSGETYVPCVEGDCPFCDAGVRKNFRYLANGYVVDDSAVKAVKLPKTVFEQLMARYMKDGTIMDRDFELSRTGSGRDDTVYMVSPESPHKMKLSRFKLLDLDEILESLLDEDDDDDDDEDERPARKKKSKASKRSSRSPWEDDDEDEDEDDDDEDDDEDEDEDDEDEEDERPRRSRKSASKSSSSKSSKKRPVKRTVTRTTSSKSKTGSGKKSGSNRSGKFRR